MPTKRGPGDAAAGSVVADRSGPSALLCQLKRPSLPDFFKACAEHICALSKCRKLMILLPKLSRSHNHPHEASSYVYH